VTEHETNILVHIQVPPIQFERTPFPSFLSDLFGSKVMVSNVASMGSFQLGVESNQAITLVLGLVLIQFEIG